MAKAGIDASAVTSAGLSAALNAGISADAGLKAIAVAGAGIAVKREFDSKRHVTISITFISKKKLSL